VADIGVVDHFQKAELRRYLGFGDYARRFQSTVDEQLVAAIAGGDGSLVNQVRGVRKKVTGDVLAELDDSDVEDVRVDRVQNGTAGIGYVS
jgi:hypothetical protein